MTDLPYGRGGSPLQNLILNGKKNTQVSALKMVEELDAGPIYMKSPLALKGSAGDIYIQVTKICLKMIDEIVLKKPTPIPQKGKMTNFSRRKPENSVLLSPENLGQLYDFIRMLDAPAYPRAFLDYKNLHMQFYNAVSDKNKIKAHVEITLRKESSKNV